LAQSTVHRALGLLRHFSLERPEIGLSEMARLAGLDKTTTLRSLTALELNGFVEQHPETRKYRLGIAPLNLARIREQSFPLHAVLKPHLDRLAEVTGETAHASLLAGSALLIVAVSEPSRATRVFVDPSEPLPLHATASGLAVLAFSEGQKNAALPTESERVAHTGRTKLSDAALQAEIEQVRRRGYALADSTFEEDVIGTAVPIFGWSDAAIGAVGVAAVASRFDAALARLIADELLATGQEISRQIGGRARPARRAG